MRPNMLTAISHAQVLRAIVVLLAVQVMHLL
jgi:hypothetical protein